MKIRFAVFLIGAVFITLFGGVNYYIGLRGWQNIGSSIPLIGSRLYWIAFWCISMSYILARLAGTFLPAFFARGIELAGAYWLAAMFYLLMLILLIDVTRFADRKFKFLPAVFSQDRRVMLAVSLVLVASVIAILAYGTWSSRSIKVSTYDIKINKKMQSQSRLKVIAISDLHLGNIVDRARLADMVHRINGLKPDLVLIPGDIVDDSTNSFVKQRMDEEFLRLKSKYGVFATLGNHDGMLQSAGKTAEVLKQAGIHVLRDESKLIADGLYIIGRDDETVYRGSGDKRKALSVLVSDIDQSKPIIVMDHQPFKLDEVEKHGVDLQVSGHTHKGQIFPSNLITERIYEIDHGYLKKGNLNVVVSSGIGTWGPPIRIGSRAEIVEIILEFEKN